MKINIDGTIELEKGDITPYMCPNCKWYIKYEKNLLMVNCFHCGYLGSVDEFEIELGLSTD